MERVNSPPKENVTLGTTVSMLIFSMSRDAEFVSLLVKRESKGGISDFLDLKEVKRSSISDRPKSISEKVR